MANELKDMQIQDEAQWQQDHTCANCGTVDESVFWDEMDDNLLCRPCSKLAYERREQKERERFEARTKELGCTPELLRIIEKLEVRCSSLQRQIDELHGFQ